MTAIAQDDDQMRTGRMKAHTVSGGGGLRLHVREWGNADGRPLPSGKPAGGTADENDEART
jgi:hypothetical protein